MIEEASSSVLKEKGGIYSYADEQEDFVGLESDVETLANHLIEEGGQGRSYRVFSICGMGGSGKTALARKVCNHPKVKCYFAANIAWVYVREQRQPKEVVQVILHQLMPKNSGDIQTSETNDEPYGQLLQILNDRKCLVVLDDIWSADTWESIKCAFPSGEMGSKILLTARNQGVALHIDPNGFHHQQRLLSDHESWELLKKKAFRAGHYEGAYFLNQFIAQNQS